MKINSLSKIVLPLLLLSSIVSFASQKKSETKEFPNIVYVLADDMGQGDLSCYNPKSKIPTINLDKLAEAGAMFTDAHSGASICTPTRYGILTGRYCWRSTLKERVVSGYDPCIISDERETVATLLQRNGYKTALVGKWHLGLDWTCKEGESITDIKNDIPETEDKIDFSKRIRHGPINLGFDYFYGVAASWDFPPYIFIENDHLVEVPLFKKGGWIGEIPDGLSEKEFEKVKKQHPLATWRNGHAASLKPEDATRVITERSVKYINEYNDKAPLFMMVSYTAPHTPITPRSQFRGKSECGIYGDFCVELDDAVGLLVEVLKKKGLFENTLFIFTADNGSSLKGIPMAVQKKYNHSPSYIYKGYKARLDEGGHRVPYIVSWPGKIQPNSTNNILISLNDLYSTCADIVDEKVKDNVAEDSYSILSALEGKTLDNKERVLVHSDFSGYFGIRSGDWKLTFPRDANKSALYNLKNDPGEETNLKEKYPKKVAELKDLLSETIRNGRSTSGKVQKNEGPEHWAQLYWMK